MRPGGYDRAMVPASVARSIQQVLTTIEEDQEVRILLAVESGSRAWGFASPDSDYDVRFLYARPRDWYLALDSRRDVIERPLSDALDVSGWDIKKALQLLLKANPVLNEWLSSPIRYRGVPVVAELQRLAERAQSYSRLRARYHYLSLTEGTYTRHISGRQTVRLKKYFYALRPALALRWLRTVETVPPMDLTALREGLSLTPDLDALIDDLIARKAASSELGYAPPVAAVDRLIEAECAAARAAPRPRQSRDPALLAEANALFRRIVCCR